MRSTGPRSRMPKDAACRHFGFDEGITVEPLHLGPFGRDPIAIRVGRMTVAIRRRHAGAVRVIPAQAVNPLPLVAVAGSPNAGKSALFNALTGARQKVGNYPGVTVERHSGRLILGRRSAGRAGRPPGRLQPRPGQPRRSGHPRRARRAAAGRAPARRADHRDRCFEPRQPPALCTPADRTRASDHRRAQHGRPRQARRARARPQGHRAEPWSSRGRDGGRAPPRDRRSFTPRSTTCFRRPAAAFTSP